MAWLIPLLLSLISGWLLSRTMTSRAWTGPRWAGIGAEVALAALFGPGMASVLFFFASVAGAATPGAVYGITVSLAAVSAGVWWKFTEPAVADQGDTRAFPWRWALLAAAVVGAGLFLLDFQAASDANPNGEWDASAIWNLRARFLAGGADTWKRAVSAEIGGRMTGAAHSGYPLFLSSFLGMQWMTASSFVVSVPIAASLIFSFGLWLLLTAGLASRRSVTLGALAGLILAASELFVSQAASQYSDLLVGLAFLAALLLLDAAASLPASAARLLVAAGLAIGFAPWIKNEGISFAIAALAVIAWKFRARGLFFAVLGAAPGLISTLLLKLIAEGNENMFPATMGEAFSKLADLSRWWQILLGFGKAIADAGAWWAHPLLLIVALALVLGFRAAAERRSSIWLWVPIAGAVAAEYGLYLITTADLTWHISTSVSRLLAQLWPSLIWLTLMIVRRPEDHFAIPAKALPTDAEVSGGSKKRVRA